MITLLLILEFVLLGIITILLYGILYDYIYKNPLILTIYLFGYALSISIDKSKIEYILYKN